MKTKIFIPLFLLLGIVSSSFAQTWGSGWAILGGTSGTISLDSLGVGTDTPRSLQHNHVANSGSNQIQITNTTTGNGDATQGFAFGIDADEHAYVYNYENNNVYFGTNNITRMTIGADGKVGIGDTGTADAVLEVVDDGGDIFMVSSASPNDGDYFLINTAGAIGVGTITPNANLTINSPLDTMLAVYGDQDGSAIADADSSGIIVLQDGRVGLGGPLNYGADSGGDDTYVATIAGINVYSAGLFVILRVDTDNTGACSLNINSIGAGAIKTQNGSDPVDGWLDANSTVILIYDGTNFVLQTPDANP